MKPLKTRKVAPHRRRKGRNRIVAAKPRKKSAIVRPSPPGGEPPSVVLSSFSAMACMRSRQKMAGTTPASATKTPTYTASQRAPVAASGKNRSFSMKA